MCNDSSHFSPIKHAVPHAYWGLAVAVGLGLQIVAGLLRPGPDHKLRIFFNWGHRLLGLALQVIAGKLMEYGVISWVQIFLIILKNLVQCNSVRLFSKYLLVPPNYVRDIFK